MSPARSTSEQKPSSADGHPRTSVVIVDASEIFGHALRALSTADGITDVVAVATSGAEAIRYAKGHRPDVIMIGPDLPEDVVGEGRSHEDQRLAALSEMLRAASPQSGLMVLSDGKSAASLYGILADGVAGAIDRNGAIAEFHDCLEATARREPHVSSNLALHLLGRRGEENPLSERETEILTKVAYGKTNAEIAGELHLSIRTVESHRAHIYDKLELGSRAELVRYALDHGYLH